jgi:hypothetical protein
MLAHQRDAARVGALARRAPALVRAHPAWACDRRVLARRHPTAWHWTLPSAFVARRARRGAAPAPRGVWRSPGGSPRRPALRNKSGNHGARRTDKRCMNARQAHTLQQHALDSLAELRSWLGGRAAEQARAAADGAATAAYTAWGAQVDAAIRAIDKAFAECNRRSGPPPAPVEPEVDSVPPTLPSLGSGRAGGLLPPPSSSAPSRVNTQPPGSSS